MKKHLDKPVALGQYFRMITGFSREKRYADMSDEEKFEYNLIFACIYLVVAGILLTLFYLSGFWELAQG